MQASVYGRLGQEPRSIETTSGKPMTVASIAVDLRDRQGESHTEWLGVVAFGRVAEDLDRHQKGDLVSVSGRVQHNSYTTSSGERREQLQIVLDALVSARSTRPKTRTEGSGSAASPSPDEFDDLIPF